MMRIAMAVAVLMMGCSWLTVKGPHGRESPPRCTRSARGPLVVDIALTVLAAGALGVAADSYNKDDDSSNEVDAIGIGVGAAGIIAGATSIAVGWRRVDEC